MKNMIIFLMIFFNLLSKVYSNENIIEDYADLAEVKYRDSLMTAKKLEISIDIFLKETNESNYNLIKKAWLNARIPY